ncbi:MAG: Mitochondrial distribution and morphology protein 12 [Cyphobasidiales sp. Tagirdzhanova-0007]|nr:MAG: Mitochondrial distribution and morphology protein 12 [Cyphobasidiales sp. Tagirdzhanova-0007]
MSIDFDWSQLDSDLCSRALKSINSLLQSTHKPAFLGEVVATAFSFGQVQPELELFEVRDVCDEFLHVDYEEEDADYPVADKNRRSLSPTNSMSGYSASLNRGLPTPALFSGANAGIWMPNRGVSSTGPGYPFPRYAPANPAVSQDLDRRSNVSSSAYAGEPLKDLSPTSAQSVPLPGLSLQLHFRARYSGNMSISVQTSIKVNYPSTSFMSLPLSMQVSAIAFEGIIIIAYEGDRKRLHVSIVDMERSEGSQGLKSEVGQSDKLVLKDVGKVEQFVLDTASKALEDEIAWPNFQSFAWT